MSTAPAVPIPPPTAAPPRRGLVAVAAAAPLLVLATYPIPLITMRETAAGVGAGVTAQTWIMNANPIGLAALLLVAGSLADNLGRRRLMTYGAVTMAAASAVGGLAATPAVLIGARIAQGAAGAALLAASLGAIGHAVIDPAARARATGLWAAALGGGLTVGPLLGGALTSAWNWRAPYWLGAAAAVAVAVAARRLPESRGTVRRRLDPAGLVLANLTLVALITAVTLGRDGWTRPVVLALFGGAVVFAAAFALVETRRREPVLDLRLFRAGGFLLACGGALLTGVALIGGTSILATAWQHSHGFSAFTCALIFTVWSGASFAAALTARRLPLRPHRLLAVGYLLAAAVAALAGTGTSWPLARVLAALLVAGVGAGFVNAALAGLAVDSVPADRASMGSGANNTARYVGSSVGVAIAVAVLSARGWTAGIDAVVIGSAVTLAAAAAAVWLLPAGRLSRR